MAQAALRIIQPAGSGMMTVIMRAPDARRPFVRDMSRISNERR
jgi:hypothetical protein